MSDKLILSDAHGGDDRLQAISDATELADAEKYIHQLEANIAALEKKLAQKAAPAKAPSAKGSAKIGARKDASFTAIGTAPSINRTPVGATMVPLPYPTVQDCSNTVAAARSVRFNGCAVYLLDASTQPSGKGDEGGTGKGVRSGTVSGEIKPVTGSSSVRVEGKQVVREGDACTMNGGNNPGMFVTTLTSSAAPPATAIENSNPYKKQSDAQLAADIAAINAAPCNDAGPLASLKPSTLQQAVAAAIQRDALSGNGPGSAPPATLLQQKQLASLQSSLGMHNLISGIGDPRSPAQQFADENGMLYDSSMGGAAYGATRLVGGSDSAGRTAGVISSAFELGTGLAAGIGTIEGRSIRPVKDQVKVKAIVPGTGGVRITRLATQISAFHATSTAQQAQSVLKGIEAKYLKPESRFGPAFHVAMEPDTALAELAHYGIEPTTGIRFELNSEKMKILDLTNPAISQKYDYSGGPISSKTQALGQTALENGYNAIQYPSERASGGTNIAILNDFNEILQPAFITPIKK